METQSTKMFGSQIKKIRDILRTVGVTDQDSIIHCIAFISLRQLTVNMCKIFEIPEEFAFENFDSELDDEELRNKFWLPDSKSKCFVTYLRIKMGFKSFKFSDVITNLHFRNIFRCLEDIETEQLKQSCDIVGDIYELHLKTGSKSSRDLGQFFTNRLVIKFMVELTDPKLNDNGQIETIVDPTMGTGGFLTMAVDHINKQGKVNWKKNCKRIFGYDLDNRVRDYANINLMLETGQKFPNLFTRDTLSNDICIEEKPISCDVILANEPMGIKGLKFAGFCDRIKDLKMSGTKAEPAFLQLFMQALNKGGRCAVVVPDGVLFSTSKQHSETRKYLIENFDVREIVKMNDKNFFMNTAISASIIYFAKVDDSLEMVKFSEISLNKDSTALVYKEMKEVEYDEIRKKNYILNPSIYLEEKNVDISGIEYKTLGEICKFLPKSKRKAAYGTETGIYRFYASGTSIKFCDTADYKEEAIIIGTGGKANINYGQNFSCSSHTSVLQSSCETIVSKYVYYFLLVNIDILENKFTGSTIKNISIEAMKSIKIPIPHLSIQKQIVEKLDLLSETNANCEKLIEQLKQKFKIYMEFLPNTKEINIKDVCEVNPENISKSIKNFLYIDISSVSNNKIGELVKYKVEDAPSRAKRLVKKNDILIASVRPVLKNHVIVEDDSKVLVASTGFHVLRCKDCILPKYVFYYMLSDKVTQFFVNNATGSMYPAINTQVYNSLNIYLPCVEKQQEVVQKCDSIFSLVSSLETQITENKAMMKEILESLVFQGEESCDTKIVIEDEVQE